MTINVEAGRLLATTTAIAYLACVLIALNVNLMAFADGAYFVFVALLNDAWELKWSAISTRFVIYLLSAAPTQYLSDLFKLSPIQATMVNGYFYYLVPFIQFAAAVLMVWNRNPRDLVYLSVQFSLMIGFSFGFPSEILFAPGFLWICLYSTRYYKSHAIFYISFFLLVFCHELALFASLVAVYDHFRRRVSRHAPLVQTVHLTFIAATYALFVWLIAWGGGTEGSQSNLASILDPRLLLANPMLWIVILAALFVLAFYQRLERSVVLRWIVIGMCAACPPILYVLFNVSFETGRYSARTITAGMMLLLALLYVIKDDEPRDTADNKVFALFIYCVLGIAVTSLLCFGHAFSTINSAVHRLVEASPATGKVADFDYRIFESKLTAQERQYFEGDTFYWTLPFRAILLENGQLTNRAFPHYDVRSYEEYLMYKKLCNVMQATPVSSQNLPAETFEAFRDFACTRPPGPKPRPFSERVRNALKRYAGYIGFNM